MKSANKQRIIGKSDHQLILNYLERNQSGLFSSFDAEERRTELKRVAVVNDDELPEDVVRLNARIRVRDQKAGREMELTLVTPKTVNIRERKISIMSPIGIALIGCRKGQVVTWNVPAGSKRFEILEVWHGVDASAMVEQQQ